MKLLRHQQINKNLRIHNTPHKLQKILSISPIAIETIIERTNANRQLVEVLDCNELAQCGLLDEYCNKSGNFVGTKSQTQVAQLLAVHGMEKTKFILAQHQTAIYSPLWLCTDPQALAQLSSHDPIGYFIYNAAQIFEPIAQIKSGITTAPGTTLDSQAEYDRIPVEDTAKLQTPSRVFVSSERRYLTMLAKVTANKQLQTGIIPEADIIRVNELLRRQFALVAPSGVYKTVNLTKFSLQSITANREQFAQFEKAIIGGITNVVCAITARHKYQTTPDHVTYADILEVKRMFKGSTSHMLQKAIRSVHKSDEIMFDLRGFFVDELTASERKPRNIATPQTTMPQTQQAPKQFTGLKLGKDKIGGIVSDQSQQTAQIRPALAALLGNKGSK